MKDRIKLILGNARNDEYRATEKFIGNARGLKIADIACGTGTFIERYHNENDVVGVDINKENVAYCKEKNFNVIVGDATKLPIESASFDIVHSSHVMQVFNPNDAVSYLSELLRICKPNGKVILTTLNDFKRFYRHPENMRPYPPDAILRLSAEAEGASSPMYIMPRFKIERIWLRRDPLLKFDTSVHFSLLGIYNALNRIQYKLGIRNYFHYSAYVTEIQKK